MKTKISPEKAAIDANIEEIESSYFNNISQPKRRGNAFQYLCLSILCDIDYEDIDDEDIVDGNDEEGIDIIHHEEVGDKISISIMNCKSSKTNNFSSRELTNISHGLKYIFSEKRDVYSQLQNSKLKNKITFIRNEKLNITEVNVFYCAFNGDKIEENVKRKINEINTWFTIYFQSQFPGASFNIKCINICDLFILQNKCKESLKNEIIELEIYDKGKTINPDLELSDGTKGFITTFYAKDISKIVGSYSDKLFEKNIRGWLKTKITTNYEILETCTGDKSNLFWFMNNGITIVGDYVFPDRDKEKWIIRNLQIVNGQQTARTIYEAYKNGNLKEDVRIMCRIYQSQIDDFINMITKTTNTQTSIGSRDLMSNDSKQKAISDLYLKDGYFYQTQRGQRKPTVKNLKRTITNKKLAQIGLAILCSRPSLARKNIQDVFFNPSKYYNDIFNNDPKLLLLSFLVYNYCYIKKNINNPVKYYGDLHIARIIWHLEKNNLTKDINNSISLFESNKIKIYSTYLKSVKILKELLNDEKVKNENFSSYLSRIDFDSKLTEKLYKL